MKNTIKWHHREWRLWSLSVVIFNVNLNSYNKKQIRTLREMRKSSDLFVLVTRGRIELPLPPWKGGVLTAWPTGLVAGIGFEPMTYRVWTGCSSQLSYPAADLNIISQKYPLVNTFFQKISLFWQLFYFPLYHTAVLCLAFIFLPSPISQSRAR